MQNIPRKQTADPDLDLEQVSAEAKGTKEEISYWRWKGPCGQSWSLPENNVSMRVKRHKIYQTMQLLLPLLCTLSLSRESRAGNSKCILCNRKEILNGWHTPGSKCPGLTALKKWQDQTSTAAQSAVALWASDNQAVQECMRQPATGFVWAKIDGISADSCDSPPCRGLLGQDGFLEAFLLISSKNEDAVRMWN